MRSTKVNFLEILGRDVTKGTVPAPRPQNNGRANGASIHSIPFSPPDPNGRVVVEPGSPAYESDVLSNSLKSFGLPLPRLAFMHWPTKKPMTFWLPSRYCCA